MLKAGSKVKVLKASYGWGKVIEGDVGLIKHVDRVNVSYCIDVPGKASNWSCADGDIKYIRPKVLLSHSATKFVEDRIKWATARSRSNEVSRETRERWKERVKTMALPDTELFESMVSMLRDDVKFESGQYMIFWTMPCVINYRLQNGTVIDVPVGRFKCTANLGADPYMEIRQEESQHYHGDYAHPHIMGSSPCWGGYNLSIKTALKTADLCSVISITLDFLNSCDRHGWYNSVLNWLSETDRAKYELMDICSRCEYHECECDYCRRCDRVGDECRCRYCEGCDAREEDCECMRCPNTWDYLDDECFPDNNCHQCQRLCRNLDTGRWECWWGGYGNSHYTLELPNFTPQENGNSRYITYANGNISNHPNEERRREEVERSITGLNGIPNDSPPPAQQPGTSSAQVQMDWDQLTADPRAWSQIYGRLSTDDTDAADSSASDSGS